MAALMSSTSFRKARSRRGAALLFVAALAVAAPAIAQKAFPAPEAAVDALVDGLASHDDTAIRAVLGPDYRSLMPLDALSAGDRTDFLAAWAKGHRIDRDAAVARLVLSDGWTLPIPIVRGGEGWAFDPRAGMKELRIRRIGRNELAAIETLYAYLDAQREYAAQDRDGDGVLEYARRLLSSPGKHDGLYWATPDGEPASPAGPLLDAREFTDGYHGYRFRILEAQGPAANGGARSYLSRGDLANGFALIAWPVRYGDTGVMSFIVNHDGVVYQKDLGASSAAVAGAMTRFDPGPSWAALPPP
jgi:Protein of unknown function (DUF2950)